MRGVIVALLAANLTLGGAAQEPGEQSALQKSAAGWIDLMPGKDLAGWKRTPIPPDDKLVDKQVWSVDPATKVLRCDGVGVKEMLLYDKPQADGVFHVEWRFIPVQGKDGEMPVYNSGIYVRTDAQGKTWHQAQVAHNIKPPFMGDLFGKTLKNGAVVDFLVRGEGLKRIKPPGEWNTYEITCQGPKVSVWINGATTCTWEECPVAKGHIGLQAEYFVIEFRNLKFKAAR